MQQLVELLHSVTLHARCDTCRTGLIMWKYTSAQMRQEALVVPFNERFQL